MNGLATEVATRTVYTLVGSYVSTLLRHGCLSFALLIVIDMLGTYHKDTLLVPKLHLLEKVLLCL